MLDDISNLVHVQADVGRLFRQLGKLNGLFAEVLEAKNGVSALGFDDEAARKRPDRPGR